MGVNTGSGAKSLGCVNQGLATWNSANINQSGVPADSNFRVIDKHQQVCGTLCSMTRAVMPKIA